MNACAINDLVVVQSFGTQVEADIAKARSNLAGIERHDQADRAGGMRDHLAWSGFGFKVLVRDEDASAAHDFSSRPAETPRYAVKCPPSRDSVPKLRRSLPWPP